MQKIVSLHRALAYLWASPNTLVGLCFFPINFLGKSCRCAVVDGVLEMHGPAIRFVLRRCTPLAGGAIAMTLGHVVLARDAEAQALARDHERVHVRQCERWGPLFIPAYLAASLIAWMRGGHFYRDNRFEREAYESR